MRAAVFKKQGILAVEDVPDPVPETPPPTPEQVRLIREVIDPRRILLGG